MKFVLILMVRNESRILERCLKSVQGLVDAFCIHDTGSTDTTREIARSFLEDGKRKGCLTESVWKDFGSNRTTSFNAAQDYLKAAGWDLATTYGLLLDADMMFHSGSLKEQALGELGYSIVQCAGTLEYPNCRLVRMDYPWRCQGVTHEYWDGPTSKLPKTTCWIEDHNDGGCKSDKFERDARLLEKGLAETPTNERYMFYLAQTYHSLRRFKDCIAMYKKRITAGGWYEEVWYSHYMIGQSYLSLDDPVRFEVWMQRAYQKNPNRAEPLYKLTKYFRERAQHYKAYYYMQLGKAIPLSTESLFVESDVYTQLFHYEQSILEYYVHPETKLGLRSSMEYMLRGAPLLQGVLYNLKFYAKPLGPVVPRTNLPRPFGETFQPTVISVREYPFANVRYVNYYVENGNFLTRNNEPVQTENAYVNLETGEVVHTMNESTVGLPAVEGRIRGLEDIRLYDTRFTATVHHYSDRVQILQGDYTPATGSYDNCKLLPSPYNRPCEKNWIGIPNTNDMIYTWHPFEILGDTPVIHQTPPFFSLLRGSGTPMKRGDDWWVLTHLVEYSHPRNYYHCFVILDSTYKPKQVSLPFVFRSVSIEYCVYSRFVNDTIECFCTQNEKDPGIAMIPVSALEWMSI
jgi:glycosyltransferase involved in cell wall biosynthesis